MIINKYYFYTTIQGDTFDSIALDFYNEEVFSSEIIKVNKQYRSTLVFDEGVRLKIPIIDSRAVETLPPWKR